ncbi:hypothetical protein GTW66_20300 [Streptomyces sp. SID5473]|uniref:hypothetical protein n=1 Tax=Streptomyces sp. SID5473 TaxID=2690299 RepID=UPI00131CA841|nr:hypothetical protein [Streptomyces sp. SID5473]
MRGEVDDLARRSGGRVRAAGVLPVLGEGLVTDDVREVRPLGGGDRRLSVVGR